MVVDCDKKIALGVSRCLLGDRVRYDGNHKEQQYITRELAKRFRLIPICPEIEIGLGVPRSPIRLVGTRFQQRLVSVKDESVDLSQVMVSYAKKLAVKLDDISGYIFKKSSPSCGLYDVEIYSGDTQVENTGIGMYAREIIQYNPNLPVEEEDKLADAKLRRNFLRRVEDYHRRQNMLADV